MNYVADTKMVIEVAVESSEIWWFISHETLFSDQTAFILFDHDPKLHRRFVVIYQKFLLFEYAEAILQIELDGAFGLRE